MEVTETIIWNKKKLLSAFDRDESFELSSNLVTRKRGGGGVNGFEMIFISPHQRFVTAFRIYLSPNFLYVNFNPIKV